jgi:hypothetical protein
MLLTFESSRERNLRGHFTKSVSVIQDSGSYINLFLVFNAPMDDINFVFVFRVL